MQVALFATVCTTISYILIDYSGNGSLYMLQTLFMLLFIHWNTELTNYKNGIYLGIVMGLGYLTNYQMVILPFGLMFYTLYLILTKTATRERITYTGIAYLVSLLVITSWLIRNYTLFGDPLYNVNNIFVFRTFA